MKINILTISTSERLAQTVEFYNKWNWQVKLHYNDNRFPSWGRNEILEDFYNSGDEWCCIADDDITLFEDRNETEYFLTYTQQFLNSLPQQITVFSGLNGVLQATNIIQNKQAPKHVGWCFKRNWNVGKMIFIRRTPNRYYQRTDLEYSEDHEYIYQHLADGYWCGHLENIVMRERGASTLFIDPAHRKTSIDDTTQKLLNLWSPLVTQRNGQLNREQLMAPFEPSITIPFSHKKTVYNSLFEETA